MCLLDPQEAGLPTERPPALGSRPKLGMRCCSDEHGLCDRLCVRNKGEWLRHHCYYYQHQEHHRYLLRKLCCGFGGPIGYIETSVLINYVTQLTVYVTFSIYIASK